MGFFIWLIVQCLNFSLISWISLNSVLYKGASEYQDIALLDTKRFGKVRIASHGFVSSFKLSQKIHLIFSSIVRIVKKKLCLDIGVGDWWKDAECRSWRVYLSRVLNSPSSFISLKVSCFLVGWWDPGLHCHLSVLLSIFFCWFTCVDRYESSTWLDNGPHYM